MVMIYTTCKAACPRLVADMRNIESKIPKENLKDLNFVLVSIDPEEYQEAEYGVFVKNNSREQDKLQQIKQLTMAFAQNGQQPSTIAEIIDSNNFTQIKKLMAEVDVKQKEMQAQATEMANQQAQAQMQAAAEMKQQEQAFTSDQNEKDRVLQFELKKMEIASKLTTDADGNGRRDEIDRARLDVEKEKVNLQKQKG